MRLLQEFHSIQEAQIAKSFLAANDINTVFVGEESISAMPHISVGMKSFQLLVQEEDYLEARTLLENVEEHASEDEPVPHDISKASFSIIGAGILLAAYFNYESTMHLHSFFKRITCIVF